MNLLHKTAKCQEKRLFLSLSVCFFLGQTAAFGQSITPATDGIGTIVNPQGNRINTLLFSLDTGLRSLPLAALYEGKQFLVEKYSLSQIPTISLTDTRYQSLQNAFVLAMGAAQFTKLSPLPAVPVELATIAELWQEIFFERIIYLK